MIINFKQDIASIECTGFCNREGRKSLVEKRMMGFFVQFRVLDISEARRYLEYNLQLRLC